MTEPAVKRRAPRVMRIALALSLGLNLMVLGLVAGLAFSGVGRHSNGPMMGLRAIGLGPFVPALSADDRRALGGQLRENRDLFAEDSRPLGRAIRGFIELLRADSFDRAAAEVALSAQRGHGAALQEAGHGILLDHVEAMSPEARALFADRLEQSLRRAIARNAPDRGDDP
ncbi:MAG: periplasmic heavy metal sensor [Pseudomonadota bacterium]